MSMFSWKKVGIFAGGVLFGSAGLKILGSRDAKRVYTQCIAAGLRARDCAMDTVTTVQENFEDILEEAQLINEERAMEEEFWDEFEIYDDCDCEDDCDCDEECDCGCEEPEAAIKF